MRLASPIGRLVNRHQLVVLSALAVFGGATACGTNPQPGTDAITGDGSGAAVAPTEATSQSLPDGVVASPPAPFSPTPPPYDHTWTGQNTDAQSDTWTSAIKIGHPMRLTDLTEHEQPFVLNACPVDGERDALVPYEITLTSTTAGFTIAASATFNFTTYSLGGHATYQDWTLQGGQSVSASTEAGDCQTEIETADPAKAISFSASSLSNGQTVTQDGAIILKNAYSPGNPSGDDTLYHQIWLDQSSMSAATTSETGTIAIHWGGWKFPIDGTALPNCSVTQGLEEAGIGSLKPNTPCQ